MLSRRGLADLRRKPGRVAPASGLQLAATHFVPNRFLQKLGRAEPVLLHDFVEIDWQVDLHTRHASNTHTLASSMALRRTCVEVRTVPTSRSLTAPLDIRYPG
ncbi:MAG: hypothetical protein JNL98_03870 [Bryobacterales bacterium]|nr:hypothetical protein [Bryobacterales bacterium]